MSTTATRTPSEDTQKKVPPHVLYRFNQDIDELTGYRTRTMMCSPIKVRPPLLMILIKHLTYLQDGAGDVIGVSQVINKNGESYFSNNDEKVFEKYLQFCGIGLRNAQLYERSQLEVKRNQVTKIYPIVVLSPSYRFC